MKTLLLAVLLLSTTSLTSAQTTKPAKPLQKEKFHLHSPETEDHYGYAQAVKVGNTIYISGTEARGTLPAQVESIYQKLEKTLAGYGLTFQHVVKETVYITDMEAFKQQNEVRKRFYKGDFPATSWVEVRRLFMPEYAVEIELVAMMP